MDLDQDGLIFTGYYQGEGPEAYRVAPELCDRVGQGYDQALNPLVS